METNQHYIDRLEKKGVKPTAVRILVLKAITEAGCPVSLPDLETMLETVDKSTIFRSLNVFLAHHVVHDIEDGSGSLKYEACAGEETCSIDDMHKAYAEQTALINTLSSKINPEAFEELMKETEETAALLKEMNTRFSAILSSMGHKQDSNGRL